MICWSEVDTTTQGIFETVTEASPVDPSTNAGGALHLLVGIFNRSVDFLSSNYIWGSISIFSFLMGALVVGFIVAYFLGKRK